MNKIKNVLIIVLVFTLGYVKSNFCSPIDSALLLVHDSLVKAIQHSQLGKPLDLTPVFLACDFLDQLCISATVQNKNEEIAHSIVQHVNAYLLHNPNLIKFLENLNESVEEYKKLSKADIAIISHNSALLFSIDDILSLGKILAIVNGTKDRPIGDLSKMLKVVELDESKCALQLWEKRDYLRRLYGHLEYQAATLSEKMKYTRKCAKMQKIMATIISLLGITDEYAFVLKKIEPGQYSMKKLCELYEDAFCGEQEKLSVAAYARSIEKQVRERC